MTLTCGELLVKLLEDHGVDTLFGIPGVHTIELYRGLKQSSIRHIAPRHEQGIGFMADGYARSSGKVGVGLCITGPGMTNIATALGQAYADSVPLLVISGVNQRDTLGHGRGQLHEMKNQRDMLAGVTAFSHTVLRADDLPEVMARAFAVLQSERPRPVHIEIPIDIMASPVDVPEVAYALPKRPGPDPDDIAAIAARLAEGRRFAVLAGGGAVDAAPELRALVERLGAPTCLTINGRGLLPADHPLLLDSVQFSDPFRDYLASCDTVLAIGTELGETDYDFFGKGPLSINGTLIRIDLDPRQLSTNVRPDLALVSDAKLALRALAADLAVQGCAGLQEDGAAEVLRVNQAVMAAYPAETAQYRDLLAMISAEWPDVIIVGDSTKPVYHTNFTFRAAAPRRWFNAATGFGTLGYALPAAMGAKVAKPDLGVVAIAGDGGFQFTHNELMTAVQENIPVIVIVWNNYSYGEIRDYMNAVAIDPIGVDPQCPDYGLLARAMGAGYLRAEALDDIRSCLGEAARMGRPVLVEYVATQDA